MSKSKNITTRGPPFNDVPPQVLSVITEFLVGAHVQQMDLNKAHIRPSVKNIFPFIIFMYSLLIIVGVVANLGLLIHIFRYKLHKDPTYAFLVNNAISDIVKCSFIVPISLYVLLVQNWMLGELLCSFLPMFQDIPIHVSTLTFVLIAWDRFRYIRNPAKPRLPAFVCAVGTWLTALCLVLPYPIYIIYVDLGKYASSLDGVGICIVNLTDDMQEYMRGIFLVMYSGPLATISYLYVKSSRELQSNSTIIMYETRHRESRSRTDSHSTTTDIRSNRGDCDGISQYSRGSYRDSRVRHEHYDNEMDVQKEKRCNKYLVTIVTMYAICLCPLMVLRLARLALMETYDNTGHFDITYTMLVWIAFVPTCSTPILFAAWQLTSNRKLRQSCETVITAAGTPAGHRPHRGRDHQLAHLEVHSDGGYQQDLS